VTLDPSLWWAPEEGPVVLEQIARRGGRARASDAASDPSAPVRARLGVETHGIRVRYEQVPELVRAAGPAVIPSFGPDGPRLLAVLGPADVWGRVPLLDRQGRRWHVAVAQVVSELRAGIEGSIAPEVDGLLAEARLAPRRAARARRRLLAARLHGRAMGGGTLVRPAPDGSWLALAREAGVLGPLGAALSTRALATVLSLVGWMWVGQGALEGRVAPSWVAGWTLLMLTAMALQRGSSWFQGRAAIRGGGAMKGLLLRGAMASDPQVFKRQGVGGALARVHESQAIEDLVLSGGLATVLAVFDLGVAVWALSQAPGGTALASLLGLFLAGTVVAMGRLHRVYGGWTEHRRRLSNLLVERMTGHRTRCVQGAPRRWFDGEDEALEGYLLASRRLDTFQVLLTQVLSGGFSVLAVAILGAVFVAGSLSPAQVAVAVGALMWSQAALLDVSGRLGGLVSAVVSWQEVGPLLSAARKPSVCGRGLQLPKTPARPGEPVLRARDLRFGWSSGRSVLDGASLTLAHGDRVLLTGASGSGKSTLTSLLVGARDPDDGVVLLRGLDRASVGHDAWRKAAVAAPQFHDNHIFEHTLLFNLLLGREWPPSEADIAEARQLCRELGLGPLLERMPAGISQVVGASGWQLSHGERSRVFLARALLQGTEVVVLDESFAALDPVLMARCLGVARERAPALVVVAHP